MNKYLRLLFDREFRFSVLTARGFYKSMSDEELCRRKYRFSYGEDLDLAHPKGFSEKLMWLKLHDRRPLYTTLVDKYAVRQYISEKVGEKYLIPLLGGPWESFCDIDFDSLPRQFVLKCTHDSGSVIVCRDKSNFDIDDARRRISRRLKRNYYCGNREWPYKDVPPRIIAEEYLCQPEVISCGSQEENTVTPAQLQRKFGLLDYRFMCFNGRVRALFLNIGVIDGKGHSTENCYSNIYDRNFRLLPVRETDPNYPVPIQKPENFETMVSLAEELSQGFPFLRVDLYNISGKIKFGELTFYHNSALANIFDPPEWDEIFGSWIELPGSADTDADAPEDKAGEIEKAPAL